MKNARNCLTFLQSEYSNHFLVIINIQKKKNFNNSLTVYLEKIVRILGAVLEESKFAFLKFYEKHNDHELLSNDSNSFFKIIPF